MKDLSNWYGLGVPKVDLSGSPATPRRYGICAEKVVGERKLAAVKFPLEYDKDKDVCILSSATAWLICIGGASVRHDVQLQDPRRIQANLRQVEGR